MDPVADIAGILPLWQSVGGGDPAIRIAIIDGPVDLTHPSLRGTRVGANEQTAAAASSIRSEHGTHVTSVIMGAPDSPVLGVAPNCSATVYPIYREDEHDGLLPTSQAAVALAINRAIADGADVINISSGEQVGTGQAQRVLLDAVRACARAGTLIVAAAGNDGCRCLHVPAALHSVLAVGACDLEGRPLPFSNFGDSYLENGILAPGKDVKGGSVQQSVAMRSGTSFAAPIVTGVVALLLSLLRKRGRDADPRAVRSALIAGARPCIVDGQASEGQCLAGQLDVSGAVAALFAEEDAPQGMSTSQPRAPPAALRHAHQANDSRRITPLHQTREGSMDDSPTGTVSAPRIVGPDAYSAATTAAVLPSEAPSVPASAAMAEAPAMPAAAPATLAPPAGALWVPMSTVGSIAPSWALGQVGGVVPSAALPQIILPPAVPTPPPMQPPTQPVAPVSRVPASCGCNGVRPSQTMAPPNSQMAFAIGRLYYDFGTEARLDYFVQTITHWRDNLRDPVSGAPIGDAAFGVDRDKSGDLAAPYNPEILARYLNNFPQGVEHALVPPNWQDAAAIIWTQTIDAVPIYAVKPFDVFGLGFYASLLAALYNQEVSSAAPGDPASYKKPKKDEGEEYDAPQIDPLVERVVFAGYLDGSTTKLLNGTVVPTLINDWRGFYQWNLEILLGPRPQWPEGVETFLERIYNEFRNVGVSPQDRALNYSAINAHNTKEIFFQMAQKKMRLDNVEVDRSTICRPDSDCWDVTYRFFDPSNVLTQARKVFQYTIDVSDVVPVAVGKLRKWEVY